MCVTIRNKREARSYSEIALSVGVDSPADITFATDVLAEAVAAKEAGELHVYFIHCRLTWREVSVRLHVVSVIAKSEL